MKTGKVSLILALLLPVFLWILAACKAVPDKIEKEAPPVPSAGESRTPGSEVPPKEPEGGDGYAEIRPRPAARDELTAVFSRGEVELDFRKSYLTTEAQLYTALYEGLFSYDPRTLGYVPAAADNWTISEDKKQWTFTIREKARYWNGDSLKAEDFRASWLSLLEPERNSPYSSLFDIIEGAREYRLGLLTDPAKVGITAEGDKKLVVRLVSPAAYFPSMLCHHSFSPIHPSMLKEESWSRRRPVSNGPFYITEFDEEHIILVKNKNYWDETTVSLNKITLKFTENGDEASSLWNSGEAHWISGDVSLEALTDLSGITLNPMFATHYYFIRSAEKPWDDHRVRRALSLVLPWDEIRTGYYLPAKTLIFPIPGYPEIEGLDRVNVEEARALLAEAGYPMGVGLPELVIRITPSPDAERLGRLMAAAWFEKLGVPVKIDVVPYSRYFQSLKGNDYEVGSTTWIGDFADPYTFLQMWRRDSNLNDARHDDADYEELMEKSMAEEGEKRWSILAEAEKLLLSRGSVLPISFSPALNVVDTDEIDGWYPNVLDIHPFKNMSFRAYRPLPGVALGPN
ncbi:MAG: peptide ABC transporter substrate-binding protein [Treponema sp.]|nr:peptide ABC transporter substrate-binding protein [Treponema sp.]